jgi:hypothetical protein
MSIDLKISNLKAFNRKLQATLDDNKVKEYVTRGTMMVQNTAEEKHYWQAVLVKHIKNTNQEEHTQHQHQINHLLVILVF